MNENIWNLLTVNTSVRTSVCVKNPPTRNLSWAQLRAARQRVLLVSFKPAIASLGPTACDFHRGT